MYGESVIRGRLMSALLDVGEFESFNDMQLQALNREVETLVAERTAELREYVQQLEAKVAERERIEKLKDIFVDTVSHELRTPMAIMREGISLLGDGILGEVTEKQQHYLDLVKRNLDRLARTINNLLDISQIESGKMTLCRRETELVQLVAEVHSIFKQHAERVGIELRINVPREPVMAEVDPDAVLQMLTNLVGNALKFTSEGFVEISATKDMDSVVLKVADSGCGIRPSDMGKLFEKFERGNSLVRREERGSGLGLTITKYLVDLHGGMIQVDSNPGKGTQFLISLPLN